MRQGYEKLKDFLGRFAKVGGKLLPGSDPTHSGVPGIGLHHEMLLFIDAGLSTMEVIVSATKDSAEFIRKSDILGTIQEGKLADIIVVKEDPLTDIRNLRKIDLVIKNGEMVDTSYHKNYCNSIPKPLRKLVLFDELVGVKPEISSISPGIVVEGGDSFTLTVSGKNFSRASTVQFNGVRLPTKFENVTQVTAEIPKSLIEKVGVFPITVTTPTRTSRDQLTNPFYLMVKFR